MAMIIQAEPLAANRSADDEIDPTMADFLTDDLSKTEKAVLSLLVRGHRPADMAVKLKVSINYCYLLTRQLRCRFFTKTTAGVVSRAITLGIISADGTFITPPSGR